MRERIDTLGIDCGPVVDGLLRTTLFNETDALAEARDYMAEHFGEALELWPRDRLREALLTSSYHGALLAPRTFHFHPLNYCRGLADAAQDLGVRIHEGSPAVALDRAGAELRVHCRNGAVRARAVVLTCGGYIESLNRRVSGAIVPVATYVIATEPLGEERLGGAIRVPYGISDGRLANDYYRPLADTRILWGGRMSVRRSRPPNLDALLLGDLLRIYPQLHGTRIESAWHGLMSYPVHKMPQVGELEPGLWYAMGFGGHGLNTTTMAGEMVAGALARGDDRYRLLAPFGLVPTGGPFGAAAAQLTYWYYQLQDRWRGRRRG